MFEAQGGLGKEAAAVIHGIAESAAAALQRDPATVKSELLGKIAVVLCRAAARSINRRRRAQQRFEARPVEQLRAAEQHCIDPPEALP